MELQTQQFYCFILKEDAYYRFYYYKFDCIYLEKIENRSTCKWRLNVFIAGISLKAVEKKADMNQAAGKKGTEITFSHSNALR